LQNEKKKKKKKKKQKKKKKKQKKQHTGKMPVLLMGETPMLRKK